MAGRSEFFGTQHGDHEVGETNKSEQADEEVFHGGGACSQEERGRVRSAEFAACIDVGGAESEEGGGEQEGDQVIHGGDFTRRPVRERMAWRWFLKCPTLLLRTGSP
jgi:hypothetical protein